MARSYCSLLTTYHLLLTYYLLLATYYRLLPSLYSPRRISLAKGQVVINNASFHAAGGAGPSGKRTIA